MSEAVLDPMSMDFKLRGGCARLVRYAMAGLSTLQKVDAVSDVAVSGLSEAAARRKLVAHILGVPGLSTAEAVDALDEKGIKEAYDTAKIAVLRKHMTKELLNTVLSLPAVLPEVAVLSEDTQEISKLVPEAGKLPLLTLARGAVIRKLAYPEIAKNKDLHVLGMVKVPKKDVVIDRTKELAKLPASVLKAVCRERGCRPSGKKDELLARLAVFGGEFARADMDDDIRALAPSDPKDILNWKSQQVKDLADAMGLMSDRAITKTVKEFVISWFDNPLFPEIPVPPQDDILDSLHDQDVIDFAKMLMFPKQWKVEEYRTGLKQLRDGVSVVDGGGAKERLKRERDARTAATKAKKEAA